MLFAQRICNKRENFILYGFIRIPTSIYKDKDDDSYDYSSDEDLFYENKNIDKNSLSYLKVASKKGKIEIDSYYTIDVTNPFEIDKMRFLYYARGIRCFHIKWTSFLPFDHNHEILKEILSLQMTGDVRPIFLYNVCYYASDKNMKLIWSFIKGMLTSEKLNHLCKNLVLYRRFDFIKFLLPKEIKIDNLYPDLVSIFTFYAIEFNYFELFEYLLNKHDSECFSYSLYEDIIKYDRSEIFKLFLSREPEDSCLEQIILYDRLEMLKIFVKEFHKDFYEIGLSDELIDILIFHKRILMIDCLIENDVVNKKIFVKHAEKYDIILW
jgi:hypothetical protein